MALRCDTDSKNTFVRARLAHAPRAEIPDRRVRLRRPRGRRRLVGIDAGERSRERRDAVAVTDLAGGGLGLRTLTIVVERGWRLARREAGDEALGKVGLIYPGKTAHSANIDVIPP